jgi:purine-binding chemotaxis protein CheW
VAPETPPLSLPNAHAAAAAASQDSTATDATRAQYLTFELAGQNYGLEILCVQEIRAWEPPTRLPHAPEHVLGVINLRGAVVPILDLGRRFGLSVSGQLRAPVIIVVNTPTARGTVTSGLVVDAVCDVCEIAADSIQPAPDVGPGWIAK